MSGLSRPRLAAHARYRFDELRQEHQLVFPEGLFVLNETAAAIVRLCDGRPRAELEAALERSFESVSRADLALFLDALARRRLVRDAL